MDTLSSVEEIEYKTLAAKANATGDMEELKKFVNDKVFCRKNGEPANFGDGTHYTCPTNGGRKRRTKKRSMKRGKKSKKGGKTRKNVKSKKTKRHSKRRKGMKSKKRRM